MLDREVVIAYLGTTIKSKHVFKENEAMVIDSAVELLKKDRTEEDGVSAILACGGCGKSLMRETGIPYKYCPWCGRKIKWGT